jgi:hypothetical protein
MSQKLTPALVPAQPPRFQFPLQSSERLSEAYRLLDDLSRAHAERIARQCGGDAARILETGYGLATSAFLRTFSETVDFVRLGLVIMPCRNASGEIIALHDDHNRWLTPPAVHIANPIRAGWAEVRLCRTTSEADSLALELNVCAVGMNECNQDAVASALDSLRNTSGIKSLTHRLRAA